MCLNEPNPLTDPNTPWRKIQNVGAEPWPATDWQQEFARAVVEIGGEKEFIHALLQEKWEKPKK